MKFLMENVQIAATNGTRVDGRWSSNSVLELKCNDGFSFSDGGTEKTTMCVEEGDGVARWNYLESCIARMDNY